jgi:hypothetical protein
MKQDMVAAAMTVAAHSGFGYPAMAASQTLANNTRQNKSGSAATSEAAVQILETAS